MKTGICLKAIQNILIFGFLMAWVHLAPAAQEGEFLYDNHNRRDPFIPLVGPGAQATGEQPSLALSSIKLEGVVVDPKQGSFVMIDGEIYEEGHNYGPYLIEKVEEKHVILKYNNKRYDLKLSED